MHEFLENKQGVHIMGLIGGGEFTMCGCSFDIAETEGDYPHGTLKATTKKTVTCPNCIAVIMHCRGVKTSSNKG